MVSNQQVTKSFNYLVGTSETLRIVSSPFLFFSNSTFNGSKGDLILNNNLLKKSKDNKKDPNLNNILKSDLSFNNRSKGELILNQNISKKDPNLNNILKSDLSFNNRSNILKSDLSFNNRSKGDDERIFNE
jgi:hypothetical protein